MTTAAACVRALSNVAEHLEGLDSVSVSLPIYPWATTPTVDLFCTRAADARALAAQLGLGQPTYLTGPNSRIHCNWSAAHPDVEYRVGAIFPTGVSDLDAAVAAEQLAVTP